jgi:hypothetical protein
VTYRVVSTGGWRGCGRLVRHAALTRVRHLPAALTLRLDSDPEAVWRVCCSGAMAVGLLAGSVSCFGFARVQGYLTETWGLEVREA